MIREYEPDRDRDRLRAWIVALQEFERGLEPALPPGEEMADAYLAFLLKRCSTASGRVFVAEVDHAVVGFIGVLPSVVPDEPDEDRVAVRLHHRSAGPRRVPPSRHRPRAA